MANPVAAQTIAMAFWQTWSRDRDGIVAAVQAIPSQQERDAVSRLLAETMGCTPFLGAEKLTLLRETHSDWKNLEIVPFLLSHEGESLAADVVAELPPGPIRDGCVLTLAARKLEENPATALDMVVQTAATPRRNESLRTMFRSWSDRQPADAQAWLQRQDAASVAILR